MARTFNNVEMSVDEIRFRLKFLREEQNQIRFNLAETSAEINNLQTRLEEVSHGKKDQTKAPE